MKHGHALDVGGAQQVDGHEVGARATREISNAPMSVNLDDIGIGIFARESSTSDSATDAPERVEEEDRDTPTPAVIEVQSDTNGVGGPNQATGGEDLE